MLIVEDTEAWSELFSNIFSGQDIDAVVATTVAEAHQLLGEQPFSEAVVDSLGGGWIALVQELMNKEIPVKLVTGSRDPKIQTQARKLGVTFLRKVPFNMRAFLAEPPKSSES